MNLRPAAAVAAVVLVLVLLVKAVGGGDDFGPAAKRIADSTASTGRQVAGLATQVKSLDRVEMFKRIASWQRRANADLAGIERLDVPKDYRRSAGFLTAALGLRAEAIRRFEPAVRNALSDRDLQVAQAALLNVMRDLLLADRAYEQFVASWPSKEERPPESKWLADEEDATIDGVSAFVRQLRQLPALEATYNLTVAQVTVSPKKTGVAGDVDQLPFTRSLRVEVVIENTGNQPIPASAVAAVLTSETDPEPRTVEGQIGPVRPKERKSVTLEGLEATAGGPRNLLRVTVGPIGGEKNLLDNSLEYKFVMRKP